MLQLLHLHLSSPNRIICATFQEPHDSVCVRITPQKRLLKDGGDNFLFVKCPLAEVCLFGSPIVFVNWCMVGGQSIWRWHRHARSRCAAHHSLVVMLCSIAGRLRMRGCWTSAAAASGRVYSRNVRLAFSASREKTGENSH